MGDRVPGPIGFSVRQSNPNRAPVPGSNDALAQSVGRYIEHLRNTKGISTEDALKDLARALGDTFAMAAGAAGQGASFAGYQGSGAVESVLNNFRGTDKAIQDLGLLCGDLLVMVKYLSDEVDKRPSTRT